MATKTSAAAGRRSVGATWVGGIAPVAGDKYVLNHQVEFDDTIELGVDGATDSVLINNGGVMKASRVFNSVVTVRGRIKFNAAGAIFDYGKSTDVIPSSVSHRLILNRDNTAGGHLSFDTTNLASFGFYIHGDTNRKRVTKLTSAITSTGSVSFDVADATGWIVGDEICFGHSNSSNPSTTQYEEAPITGISGNTVTATVAYTHKIGCFVGNMTSNVSIESYNGANPAGINVYLNSLTAQTVELGHAVFLNMGSFPTIQPGLRFSDGNASVTTPVKTFDGMVFRATVNDATYNTPNSVYFQAVNRKIAVGNSIFYNKNTITQSFGVHSIGSDKVDFDNCLFCAMEFVRSAGSVSFEAATIRNSFISICGNDYMTNSGFGPSVELIDTVVSGRGGGFSNVNVTNKLLLTNCDIGLTHGWYSQFGEKFIRNGGAYGAVFNYESVNTKFASTLDTPMPDADRAKYADVSRAIYYDKNGSVTTQEIYTAFGTIKRDNSNNKRSTSSVAIKPTTVLKDIEYEVSIPCASGATVRVVGYCKADSSFYNGGGAGWTAPTATLSGTINGVPLTPALFTSTYNGGAGGFEPVDISITNSSGADGNVTLTFNANAKSVTTGTVYFDGVPTNSKFVTKARHYGFPIDQTLPNVSGVSAVSGSSAWATSSFASAIAAETAALALSGKFSMTGGTSQTNVALAANATFTELHDYTQAWACATANQAYAIPNTSPITGTLIAAGNLATTGWALTGGSIAMGTKTLTGQMTAGGYAFTYTGGTYAQAVAGSPSFSGGDLTLPTTITTSPGFTMSDAEIIFTGTATPTLWNLNDCTFSGTITLTNTSGAAITLEMPVVSGFTIVNTGVGAAAITVNTPVVHNYVNGTVLANTRVVLYNVTQAAEINNQLIAGTAYSFEITTEADDGDTLDLFYFKEGYAEGRTRFVWGEETQTVAVDQATDAAIQYYRAQESITDYTTLTEFNFYSPDIYIQSDDTDGVTSLKRLFIFYNGVLTTEDGARYMRGGVDFRSAFDVVINRSVVPLAVDNVSVTQGLYFSDQNEMRVTTDDGSSWIAPPSAPGSIRYAFGVSPGQIETGVSGLTGPESAVLTAAAASAAAAADNTDDIPAAVQTGLTSQGYTAARAPQLDRLPNIEKLARNKMVTDPVTGIVTIYDDNGSVLFTAQAYEDAAGTQAYRGQGAERRERFA